MRLTKRLNDYARWHELQKHTKDIDPVYPVYSYMIGDREMSADEAAWLVLLHVTYYHMGSALRAFEEIPEPAPPKDFLLRLPTGVERRGHRDPRQMEAHWLALLDKFEHYGGPYDWIAAGGTDWRALNDHLINVRGNGRWAAYKTAEMAQKILGIQTTVADAGHANSSGPRKGLQDLSVTPLPTDNAPGAIAILDAETQHLAELIGETDIGYVETSLCDFHSLVKGSYYLGHDIDAMYEQLDKVNSGLSAEAWTARAAVLPTKYLGEYQGWTGVDRVRKTIYRDRGEIVER